MRDGEDGVEGGDEAEEVGEDEDEAAGVGNGGPRVVWRGRVAGLS